MISSVVIKTEEGTMVLDVVQRADGSVERATFTVYEHDGARQATIDAEGGELVQRALCPPDRGTA